MTITVEPLDAVLGARIDGLPTNRALDTDERAFVIDAIDRHLVLLFHHDAPLAPAAVNRLCESIGSLRPTLADKSRLPGFPGINRVSNRDDGGVVGTGGSGVITWHSDLSFTPPLIEFLYLDALALPGEGGDTKWVNLVAAYDDLPEHTKAEIDHIGVQYRLRDGLDFASYFKASDGAALVDRTEISLVQTNPRTGRKSVWPNCGPDFAYSIEGMADDDTRALLTELFEHCTQERYVYRHEWQVGDSALWLNTQTMHEREAFAADQLRVLRHVNILGTADPRQVASTAAQS